MESTTDWSRRASVLFRFSAVAVKNNLLLVGNLAVGKTAIAEGLAWRIVQGDVPEVMADCTFTLSIISFSVTGTKYRGDFEKRFKALLKSWSRTLTASCLLMRSTPLSVRVQRLVARSMRLT